jgi:NAD(P)-dependent dehydrogenase (short-subunit alcohol dehydrogenase family)
VGRAITLALARAGARVVVHYNSSEAGAVEVCDEIRAAGGDATRIGADLRSLDAVERLASEAEASAPIDVLVNNASVFPDEAFGQVDGEIWGRTIAINLRAPFFLTQRIGLAMKERGSGVIVNLADLAGIQAWSGYAAHAISKAGIIHLTKVAARALAPEVRVAAIAPGTVLPPENLSTEEIERLARRTPLQRIGSADDVARTVLYLVASDFVTGEIVIVDGGRHLA